MNRNSESDCFLRLKNKYSKRIISIGTGFSPFFYLDQSNWLFYPELVEGSPNIFISLADQADYADLFTQSSAQSAKSAREK